MLIVPSESPPAAVISVVRGALPEVGLATRDVQVGGTLFVLAVLADMRVGEGLICAATVPVGVGEIADVICAWEPIVIVAGGATVDNTF